jgi:hypothetical protein
MHVSSRSGSSEGWLDVDTWPRIWLPAVVAWALSAIVLVSGDDGSWVRHVSVLSFLAFVPGMMVVRLVDLRVEWASAISLAIAVSLALDGIVAGIGLYAGFWKPNIFVYVVAAFSLLFVSIVLYARGSQWLRAWRRRGKAPREAEPFEERSETEHDRISTGPPASRGQPRTGRRTSEGAGDQTGVREVLEGRVMTHPAVEAEIEVLRGQVEELEGELARNRELVERLKIEIATYREREEVRRTSLTASGTRAEGMALDAGRASEAIREQAEARLSAALERLRASSDRADSATSREGWERDGRFERPGIEGT